MRAEKLQELRSIAAHVGASDAALLDLARVAAGDDLLLIILDLTDAGADEVIGTLNVFCDSERWWKSLQSTY